MAAFITVNGAPFRSFETLAEAWLECYEQGFVVPYNGQSRKPGMPGNGSRHGLRRGVRVIDETTLGKKKPTPPHGRWKGSKKRIFNADNWVDEL
jgi:hypothetical protein